VSIEQLDSVVKNRKALNLLYLANTISGMAQGITMLAIPWYFAQHDHTIQFGYLYIICHLVAFVWLPYSGVLIDKYSRQKIYVYVALACGAIITSVAVWGLIAGILPIYAIGAIFMMTFFNYNIHYPNLYALLQEVTEPDKYESVTANIEIQGQGAGMLAGALAAFLLEGVQNGVINFGGIDINFPITIKPWSIQSIFLVDGLTYFLSAIIIVCIKFNFIAKREVESESILTRLKYGFDFLKNHSQLFLFGVLAYMVFATAMIEAFYLAAPYVKNVLKEGGDVYANEEIYYSLGAVLAGFVVHKIFARTRIPIAMMIMTLATAILYFVVFASNNVMVFLIMILIMGFANAGSRILMVTYLFHTVPNQIYGRVGTVLYLINFAVRLLLALAFTNAFFQDGDGVKYAFLVMSVLMMITLVFQYYNQKRLKDDFTNTK